MMPKQLTYKIENTREADLNFIYGLFDAAILYQKNNGYPVWPSYDKEVLKRDIADKQQFKIIEEGQIVCIFSICYSDKAVWGKRDEGNALYLHRIVVNPLSKGHRHFSKVLSWAKADAQERSLSFIRMDTWFDNPVLIDYYKGFGFQIVGSLVTPDSEELPIQQRNNAIVLLETAVSTCCANN